MPTTNLPSTNAELEEVSHDAPAGAAHHDSAELDHVPIRHQPIARIRTAPENETLYRPVLDSDPEVQELARSIRERGLLEPLVLTRDGFLVSGHRRLTAARIAGLTTVPVRVISLARNDDPDAFVQFLREFNRQREKTAAEKLREEVVSLNPDDTYNWLIEHRQRSAQVETASIPLRSIKPRARISSAKLPFLDAVRQIVKERRAFWPLSDRQIHYALLNDPPLTHAKKPASRYRNSQTSYKALTDLLTRARIAGWIPMESIGDETRPVTHWNVHPDVRQFLRKELNGFLTGYWRDYQQSQPHHVEIIVEKNTVAGIVRPVAMDYCLRMTSGRGFCSLPPRYELAQRFTESGKDKLVLLFASDHDPEGVEIPHAFARSLRDDFQIDEDRIVAVKVALNSEQIERLALPPTMEAKQSSPNYRRFVEQHGTDAFELEALSPEQLQHLFREAIDEILDLTQLNSEIDQEREESAYLLSVRKRAVQTLSELADPEPPQHGQ